MIKECFIILSFVMNEGREKEISVIHDVQKSIQAAIYQMRHYKNRSFSAKLCKVDSHSWDNFIFYLQLRSRTSLKTHYSSDNADILLITKPNNIETSSKSFFFFSKQNLFTQRRKEMSDEIKRKILFFIYCSSFFIYNLFSIFQLLKCFIAASKCST